MCPQCHGTRSADCPVCRLFRGLATLVPQEPVPSLADSLVPYGPAHQAAANVRVLLDVPAPDIDQAEQWTDDPGALAAVILAGTFQLIASTSMITVRS